MYERLQKLLARTVTIRNNGRAGTSLIMADEALKKEINNVYSYYYGRHITGCSNCFYDALIELAYKSKQTIAKMKSNKFILKRGKILHDVINQDASLDATRDNMTDDLALYHLYTNPHAKQYFEALPEGVDKLVKDYGKKYEDAKLEKADEESTGNAEADAVLNKANEDATAILNKAKESADKVLEERETVLADREAKVLELATAVLDLDDLVENGGSLEDRDAKREEVLALAREVIPTEDKGDGGSGEPGAEVILKDGKIVTLRDGVGYNADGTVAKRGTYETADGGKIIVGNKGKARTETATLTEEIKIDPENDNGASDK